MGVGEKYIASRPARVQLEPRRGHTLEAKSDVLLKKMIDHHEGFAPTVVVLTTCRESPPLEENDGDEEAAEARRAEQDEMEFNENKREGGVCTHSLLLALKNTADNSKNGGKGGGNKGRGSDEDEDGDEYVRPSRQMSWYKTLATMRHTLHDLGSAHVPFMSSTRKINLEHSAASLMHPLSIGAPGGHRAVLVGINYSRLGGRMALRGREMDVQWMYETITSNGFDDEDGTRVLVDDGHATGQPTKKNIFRAMQWLVKGAEAGDSLLFHFSGRAEVPRHALERRSRRGSGGERAGGGGAAGGGGGGGGGTRHHHVEKYNDDDDKAVTALCPEDVDTAGPITRGELRKALFGSLPAVRGFGRKHFGRKGEI